VATILPPSPPSPTNPKKEKLFDHLRSRQEQQHQQSEVMVPGMGYIQDGPGLVPEGSNEFGLTAQDALFIEYDIRKAIEDFKREHGFDGVGYHDRYGNYIYPQSKDKELDEKCKNVTKRNKISVQKVAIEKGIIKIRRLSDDNNKEGSN
jgi:hypothetical protein